MYIKHKRSLIGNVDMRYKDKKVGFNDQDEGPAAIFWPFRKIMLGT